MGISLVGLNRADVLAALYNASKPLGMGFLGYDATPMTRAEAEGFLQRTTYFDYLKGRVMKSDLSKDDFEPWGYDRDNGPGAAERAISVLRNGGGVNDDLIKATHQNATLASARKTKGKLEEETTTSRYGNVAEMRLGLSDVAEPLNEAVDKAIKQQRSGD